MHTRLCTPRISWAVCTNGVVAGKLFLSAHTVTTHRKNIMAKLGVNNTAAMVMYAVKTGLVSPNKFLFQGEAQ